MSEWWSNNEEWKKSVLYMKSKINKATFREGILENTVDELLIWLEGNNWMLKDQTNQNNQSSNNDFAMEGF